MSNIDALLKQALEHDKAGEWDQAHEIVQHVEDPIAYQIHAYLHRKEGDSSNAHYWYNRAGVNDYQGRFGAEFDELTKSLEK